MKNDWLNLPPNEWNKKQTNYYQVLSAIIFVAFIWVSFLCILKGDESYSYTMDNIWLKQENIHLKLEIQKANDNVYRIEDCRKESKYKPKKASFEPELSTE